MDCQVYEKIDPEEYEKRYERIPREIYLRQHWLPRISELIRKYCDNKNVLDLGCGYGKYVGIIKNYANKVTGLDVSERWLGYAKHKYGDVDFILGDAQKISLGREFDVIFSAGLFEYVDRKIVIRKISQILKPGGYCIVLVPNKYSSTRLLSRIYHSVFYKRCWPDEPSKREMLNLFSSSGFDILEFKMDDGLIWLPGFLDKFFGTKIYTSVEKIFNIFGNNPFSSAMLFVVQKRL